MTCRSHSRLMRLKMGIRQTIIIRHCAAGQPGVPSSTLLRRIRRATSCVRGSGGWKEMPECTWSGSAQVRKSLAAPLSVQRKSRHFQQENVLSLIAKRRGGSY